MQIIQKLQILLKMSKIKVTQFGFLFIQLQLVAIMILSFNGIQV